MQREFFFYFISLIFSGVGHQLIWRLACALQRGINLCHFSSGVFDFFMFGWLFISSGYKFLVRIENVFSSSLSFFNLANGAWSTGILSD